MFNPLHLFLIEDNWDMLACFLKLIKQFMICEKNCNALEKHNVRQRAGRPLYRVNAWFFMFLSFPSLGNHSSHSY